MNNSMFSSNFRPNIALTALLLLSLTFVSGFVAAQDKTQIKAALIFKIGQYIEWNYKVDTTAYCFVGDAGKQLGNIILEKFSAGKIKNKVSIRNLESLEQVKNFECQILFLDKVQEQQIDRIKSLSKETLTITENLLPIDDGSIINLAVGNGKSKLFLNESNFKASNMQIDARLISIFKMK